MVSTRGIKLETPTGRRPRKSNANSGNVESSAASDPANSKTNVPNKSVKAKGTARKSGRERSTPRKLRDDDPTKTNATTRPTAARKSRRSDITSKSNINKKVAGNKRKAADVEMAELGVKMETENRTPKRIRISLKKIKQSTTSTKQPVTVANGAKAKSGAGKEVCVKICIGSKIEKKTARAVLQFPLLGHKTADGGKPTKVKAAMKKSEKSTVGIGRDVTVSIRIGKRLSKKTCVASLPSAGRESNVGNKTSTTAKKENNNTMTEVKVFVRSNSKLSKKTATASIPASNTVKTGNHEVKVSIRTNSKLGKKTAIATLPTTVTSNANIQAQQSTPHKQQPNNEDLTSPDADALLAAMFTATGGNKIKKRKTNPKPKPQKRENNSIRCKFEGCTRYRQGYTGGYCLQHKQFGTGVCVADLKQQVKSPLAGDAMHEPRVVDSDGIAPLHGTRAAMKPAAKEVDTEPLPPVENYPEGDQSSDKSPHKQCIVEGCQRYKRSRNGGYCLTHKHLWDGIEPEPVIKIAPVKSQCRVQGCVRYKRSNNGGYCLTHKHLFKANSTTTAAGVTSLPPLPGGHNLDPSAFHNFDGLLDHDPTSDAEDEMSTVYAASSLSYLGMGMKTNNAVSAPLPSGDTLIDSIGPLPGAETSTSSPDEVVTAFQSDAIGMNGENSSRKDPPENLSMKNESNEDSSVDNRELVTADATTSKPPPQAKLLESDLPPIIPEGIEIESKRKDNKGRYICKVVGCKKLDQSANKGFCRSHYNLIYSGVDESNDPVEPWTCSCGMQVGGRQKRCSKPGCFRWKDGKRQPYNTVVKRSKDGDIEIDSTEAEKTESRTVTNASGYQILEEFWTCSECGNEVDEQKSRCGNCHHWRGGKRQGGWKLGERKIAAGTHIFEDDGIDRSADWECCGEMLPAKKTRCGKCRSWRGGKRQVRWSYEPNGDEGIDFVDDEGNDVDISVDWSCAKCEHVNKGVKKRCASCSTWRFSRKKVRLSTGTKDDEDDSGSIDGGHWICKACSYDNFATEIKCLMCQKKRPNWKKYAKDLPSNENTPAQIPLQHITALNETSHAVAGSSGITAVDGNTETTMAKPDVSAAASREQTTKDLAGPLPEIVSKSNEPHQRTNALHDSSHNSNHLNNDIGLGNHTNFSSPTYDYLQSSPIAQSSFDYSTSYLHTDFLNADTSTNCLSGNDLAAASNNEPKANQESQIADNIVQV